MPNIIKPELSSGFRDYLPEEMIPLKQMLKTIEQTFEKFGFLPLDTPSLEKEDILTGCDENFKMQLYRAGLKNSNDKLALRFDLTVPLARVVASSLDKITFPFKRYQSGKVWRGERPQAGRFREFMQFDADIVGTKTLMADAEIIALIYETMKTLGLSNFLIRVNNRKILNGLPDYAGYSQDKNQAVIRILDKLDKVDWPDVERLLLGTEVVEESNDKVNLSQAQVKAIKEFLDLTERNPAKVLAQVEKIMGSSPVALEGINELKQIVTYLKALRVDDKNWEIDLSLARGLGYYTGPVFETILTDLPYIGSVFSGGRYDGLVNRFMASPIPATGASVGVDRLFVAMKELGIIKTQKVISQVLALNIDASAEQKLQEVVTKIRLAGIEAEIYLGAEKTIKGQLSYAVKNEFPVVLIIGTNELKERTIQIKDIKNREQINVKEDELISKIKAIIKA
jgi:histidyl-tRNA synthetase